jgi:hypothetical protein
VPATAQAAVAAYLAEVRRIRGTGASTQELSFYPELNTLLSELGQLTSPRRRALSNPAGLDGDFPDVALYEEASLVLALPVEAKPASMAIAAIVGGTQAARYARSMGGGRVLVTNLWQFAVAELGVAGLVVYDRVNLVSSAADLDGGVAANAGDASKLLALVDAACSIRSTLASAGTVAQLLAYHARQARDSVLGTPNRDNLLRPVSETLRLGLGMQLDDGLLVPTVVQTLVYGLFAAWLAAESPQEFDWMSASYRLEVPVFADMVHAIMRPAFIKKCDLTPRLRAAARVLQWVDRPAFLAQFDGAAIEYFYEPFLANFDQDLRNALGVWYTPADIAAYQVARADHHLRIDLGIADGLADDRVIILDPAVGTGTYLATVLRHIYATHIGRGEPPTIAADRTLAAALSRVIGFEVLPAAFVICHLHLGRLLAGLGVPVPTDARLRVYLTNSLLGWAAPPQTELPIPDFADEIAAAQHVKTEEPVLVILGNPPYHGFARVDSEEERSLLAPWVNSAVKDWGLQKLRMGDLYVRFWRMATQRISELTHRGVVSFITNRKWLGGKSYPSMRAALITAFDSISVADLHGGVHDTSVPGDESVFTTTTASGIRVGTAIVTAVLRGDATGPSDAVVEVRDFRGSSAAKRRTLGGLAAANVTDGFSVRALTRSSRYKLTSDAEGDFAGMDEYFADVWSAVQPVRDDAVVDLDGTALEARMRQYFDRGVDTTTLLARYPGFNVVRERYDAARTRSRLLASSRYEPTRLVRFLYRPFDVRWLYWEPDHKLLNEARRELMLNWVGVPGQECLVATATPRRPGAARPLASTAVPCWAAADPDARAMTRLRATNPETNEVGGIFGGAPHAAVGTNIRGEWIQAARTAGLTGSDLEIGDSIFFAIVAVAYSPLWLGEQPAENDDFPQVPLPNSAQGLTDAAALGRRLAALLDMDVPVPGVTTGAIDAALRPIAVPDAVVVDPILTQGRAGHAGGSYHLGPPSHDILWDATNGWRNVPEAVWEFHAAGHQPIPKWLSYRVGRPLTAKDRESVMHICRRITATIALSLEADTIYRLAAADPLTPAVPPAPTGAAADQDATT